MTEPTTSRNCNRNGCTFSRHTGDIVHIIGNKHYCRKCVTEFFAFCNSLHNKSIRQWTSEFEEFAKTPVFNASVDTPVSYDEFMRHANTCVIGGHNTIPVNSVPTLQTLTPSDSQINSACLSYRHDFPLLHEDSKRSIRSSAVGWLQAWQKVLQ